MIHFTRAQVYPIALDIGHDSVKMIQLERRGDSLTVLAAARAPLPPEARADAQVRLPLAVEVMPPLMVTPPFANYRGFKQVQHIVFSGGVSEHVYDRDPKAYGDIGPVLGKNMREYLKKLPKDVLREPIEGIRATVIGAGEYTIQASGNTSYVSNEKALPIHGLKRCAVLNQ